MRCDVLHRPVAEQTLCIGLVSPSFWIRKTVVNWSAEFSCHRRCPRVQPPLARLSSTSIISTPMHRCTLFCIFMSLWRCKLPFILVPRSPVRYHFIFGVACKCFCKFNSCLHHVTLILQVVENYWLEVVQKPMASCFGCGRLVARCSDPGRGRCDQLLGWSLAPRCRRGPSRNCCYLGCKLRFGSVCTCPLAC